MAIDGVGSYNYNSGYRDQFGNPLDSDKQTDETQKSEGTNWNAVFTDEKKGVSVDDFLTLMVAQLRNQDFMNPVDDTQYVTQLAQFATMQQMQELASHMKNNYVLSLVGKKVTCAMFTVAGDIQKETGPVQKISLVNNEYSIYVNDKKFTLDQIMELHDSEGSSSTGEGDGIDAQKSNYLMSLIGKNVTVEEEQSDGTTETYSGIIERVTSKGGNYRVFIDGKWHSISKISQVEVAQSKTEEV